MTIAEQAAAAVATLRAEAPRAEDRVLDAATIEEAILVHLEQVYRARRTHPGSVIITTLCGGYVFDEHYLNGSLWRQHTDHVSIEGSDEASLLITAERKPAQHGIPDFTTKLHVERRTPGIGFPPKIDTLIMQ